MRWDDNEDNCHDSSHGDYRDKYTHMLKSHLAHSSSLQIPVQQAEGGILNNVNKIKLLKCVILAPAAHQRQVEWVTQEKTCLCV